MRFMEAPFRKPAHINTCRTRLIILTESEADNVPIGEARKLWAPDALQEKEPEITRVLGIAENGVPRTLQGDGDSLLLLTGRYIN
jgi:hypothetical protein